MTVRIGDLALAAGALTAEQLEQAKAALKQARADLAKTTIYSPMTGTVIVGTPNALMTAWSWSAIRVNGKWYFSLKAFCAAMPFARTPAPSRRSSCARCASRA